MTRYGSAQLRYAMTYVFITFIMLLILNIYCSKASQNLFYESKKASMIEKCLLASDEIAKLGADGILSGGMLPKVQSCAEALNAGINKVHLIDGRLHHSLLLEIFTEDGVGTQIVRPDSRM